MTPRLPVLVASVLGAAASGCDSAALETSYRGAAAPELFCQETSPGQWMPMLEDGRLLGELARTASTSGEDRMLFWSSPEACEQAVSDSQDGLVCAPTAHFGAEAFVPYSSLTGHRMGGMLLAMGGEPTYPQCVDAIHSSRGDLMCAWTGFLGGYLPTRTSDGRSIGQAVGYIGAADLCQRSLDGASDSHVCSFVSRMVDIDGHERSGYRALDISTSVPLGPIHEGIDGLEACNAALVER